MMESKNPNVTDHELTFDYATIRRLYNMPFIDQDKLMTGEEYGNKVTTEAKEIIVAQMKRRFEEQQIQEIIKDERTIQREREELVEKLKSIKIIQYLSERQIDDLLQGT